MMNRYLRHINGLTPVLLLLTLLFTACNGRIPQESQVESAGVMHADTVLTEKTGYYNPFLSGEKKIGFEPTEDLCREVLKKIEREYVDTPRPENLYAGIKTELESLLTTAGKDTGVLKNIPLDETVFHRAVENLNGQVDKDLVLLACLRGLVRGLGDKHADFFLPEDYRIFLNKIREDEYTGIGIRITLPADSAYPAIIEVFKNGPAGLAGIRLGDSIAGIDGLDVSGRNLRYTADLLMGREGSTVKLSILRDGKMMTIPVVRKKIPLEAIKSSMLDGNIGYLKISAFRRGLGRDFRQAYSELEKKDIRSLILDLRNNPGGLVSSAQELCGCFLEDSAVLSVFVHRGAESRKIKAKGRRIVFVPVVVLINGYSASSSEIVAGALGENRVATLLGETTRGKGSVQRTGRLSGGSALKMTVEKILTPHGNEINEKGVSPDVSIPMPITLIGTEKDIQLRRAEEILKKKMKTE